MRRTAVAVTLLASMLVPSVDAHAQASARIPRVGVLSPGSSTESPTVQREPFERGLRELGWAPGSSIIIEYRYAEGVTARLSELATELVKLKVDVIVARSNPAILAARQSTASIPIVMASANDPIAAGFIKSLARPDANVTGIANMILELQAKRLELLKAAIGSIARVGLLDNVAAPCQSGVILNAAGRALGLEIQPFTVSRSEALAETFVAMSRARVDAVLVQADGLLLDSAHSQIVALAAKHRLPAMYPWRLYVDVGGLMCYAQGISEFHYRAASYVDRIVKGAKPADLPVEQSAKFELVVNLRAARALGLTIPPSFLLRANEVIE
jgi:putative ABC transport system substrate-binding protein